MTRAKYTRKRRKQRICGIFLLLASVVLLVIASTGTTIENHDCTAIILFIPLGFYMLFTRKIVIV